MKFNIGTGLAGLILMAASLLFLWFIILGGLTHHRPFNKTYFLKADTSGITGARDTTAWYYFWICDDHARDCSSAHAAYAFGNAWESNASGVPNHLGGSKGDHTTASFYYHTFRTMWAFFIMTLFFEALAFFASFISCFGRIGALIASLASFVALGFSAVAVSLMTALFVKARDRFHDDGRDAKLGKWAFGFAWASLASLGLSWILFNVGVFTSKSSSRGRTIQSSEKRSGMPWRNRNTSAIGGGRRVQESYP